MSDSTSQPFRIRAFLPELRREDVLDPTDDIIDEVAQMWADMLAQRERTDDLIQQFAESGASDELVAAAAIMAELRRHPRSTPALPWQGSLLGCTEHDLGRAAVEALRRAGRLREAS